MSQPTKTLSNAATTMYNLQIKRTLPREVIKWMQGLDLSYSVKDYRKDMSNGFLIAQIISRYQPGKIPMHAFENSHNNARRDNNWTQLALFFKKYSLRDVEIGLEEFSNIMKGTDSKSEQLYQFVCRLYSICTKRNLPQNAPILDLPPTQVNNPNLTASYLLKEDGLQKLSNNNSNILGSSGNKSNLIENSKIEEKAQDRVPTRKIVPNLDNSSNMVDVMGIGIKADNRKMTSKRKSWEAAKEESNYSQDNPDSEKLIFDYLNEIIEECIAADDHSLRQILIPEHGKYKPTESLRKIVPNIDSEYMCNFLNQIQVNSAQLIPILLREVNETWKFFSYFLKFFKHYPFESQQFKQLALLVKSYAAGCHQRQPRRLQKVFADSLMDSIINEVKQTKEWKKKEKIMQLIYDFEGRELNEKKVVLTRLKQIIGSNNPLYIQWLSVLVRQETQKNSLSPNKLIQDYIYYAHQYLSSSTQILRTSALKILYEISKSDSVNLIQGFFISKAVCFQQSQCDPEQVLLLILIYMNILRELIDSKEYQNLIKGNNANSLIKVYNPDNEKNMEELKRKAQLLGETIYRLFNCTSDVTVRQICARISISFLAESQFMMQIFLEFITIVREKEEFLKAEQTDYQLKSMKFECQSVEISIIEEHSNEILVEIISLLLSHGANLENYLYLINHSLQHLNIKKVNMQIWEDISLHIVKPYTEMLHDPYLAPLLWKGIINVCLIFFNYDMKIRELTTWLTQGIARLWKEKNQQVKKEVELFNEFLNSEYLKHHNEPIRFMIEELAEMLESKGVIGAISLKH